MIFRRLPFGFPPRYKKQTTNMPKTNTSFLEVSCYGSMVTKQVTTTDLETRRRTIQIAKGSKVGVGEAEGKGYIANLWMTFPGWFWQWWNPTAPINQSILKTLILRIYWDGAKKPAVEAPVGDFFGIGLCEVANYTSKYIGMSSGGFYTKFPMPFRKGFRIEFENLDDTVDTEIFMDVLYQLDDSLPENCGWFHSQFWTGRNLGTENIQVAELTGHGRLAGCALSMQCEDRGTLYFLEAPEHIYIDDDWEKPAIVGTALEDYFLGGWYFREGTFQGELHGVPIKDSLQSTIAMYRLYDTDAIHFQKRFRFEFVNPLEPERLRPFAYSSTVYSYIDTPEGMNPKLPSREDLLCWYRIRNCDHQSIP